MMATQRLIGGRRSKGSALEKESSPAASKGAEIDRTRSATVQIYERILDDIVSLRLKPGEPISVNDMVRRFGTSRSPVREAIIGLTKVGLIEIFPQSGTRVSPISMDVVREVYFVRRSIEVALVEELANLQDPEHTKVLRDIVLQQRSHVSEKDILEFYRLDELFHQTIAEFAGYPCVWQSMHNQKFQMDRLRHVVLPLPSRSRNIVEEHGAIIDGIASGDSKEARAAMAYHLQQIFVLEEVLREKYPDYFE